MRNAFAKEIRSMAGEDSRIVILSGDIGNRLFDPFKAAYPGRFFNCGIAEANMISMAAGLAASGLRPVCYTIAPFLTTRCLEQIKVDVCYHNVPVVLVGTGCGLSYAALGSTHHSFEDIGILRPLPGLRVASPADASELRAALRQSVAHSAPTYLRIGKKGEPVLLPADVSFQFGRWQQVQEGDSATLLSCGTVLAEALAAARLLETEGHAVAVWNCASVKPLDESALLSLPNKPILSVEEHSIAGGFGAAIAEFFADAALSRHLIRRGIPDRFLHDCGEQAHARAACGLDAPALASALRPHLPSA